MEQSSGSPSSVGGGEKGWHAGQKTSQVDWAGLVGGRKIDETTLMVMDGNK